MKLSSVFAKAASCLLALLTIPVTSAYADDSLSASDIPDKVWVHWENCNPFRLGGVNKIDGAACQSKEETEALEARLRNEDYILINTDDKDISDEEFELLCGNQRYYPPYYEYADLNSGGKAFNWDMKMRKIYVYRPSYDDVMEQLKERGQVKSETQIEMSSSAVLIDYGYWFFADRVGKTVNEYDDNIPSWFPEENTGYALIKSPIDVTIRFFRCSSQTYYEIPVTGSVPRLVKMKKGRYIIEEINRTSISIQESTLSYNNDFQIDTINTKDDPYVISIDETVEKYGIEPMTPEEITEEEKEEEQKKLTEERTIVEEQEKQEENQKFWTVTILLIVLGVILLAALVIVIVMLIVKKKYSKYSKER